MEVNGDLLVEVLSLPEWDTNVLNLLDLCEVERISIDEEELSIDIEVDKYKIELEFSRLLKSEKQLGEAEQGNIYLEQVFFDTDCLITLPFGLEIGDTTELCIKKIFSKTKPLKRFKFPAIYTLLLKDENKKYLLDLGYTEDSDRVLIDVMINTFDINMTMEYLEPNEVPLDYKIKGSGI